MIMLFLFLIIKINCNLVNQTDFQLECAIFNNFNKDHLFADSLIFESFQTRNVYTKEIPLKYLLNNGLYFKENKESLWILEPSIGYGKNLYFFKNKKYEEFLYAEDDGFFGSKRDVNTKKLRSSGDSAFMWKFLKTKETGIFKIVNFKYAEFLHGADLSNKIKFPLIKSRDCWTSKISDANELLTNWYLFCHNNLKLTID